MCACKTPFRLAPGGGVFNPCPDVNMALGTVFNYPWQSLCCQAGHAPEQGRVRLGQTHPKSLYFPIDRGTSRKEEKPPTAKAPASQRLKQDFCVPARKTALFARKPTKRRPKGPCPLASRASFTGIESRAVLTYVSSKKRQMTPPAPKRLVLTDNRGK